ncbi:trimeric autotransporter adhesin [Gammaproteobacteria bacterium]
MLTSAQVSALSTSGIAVFSTGTTGQLQALGANIVGLTTAQITALSTTQVQDLTTTQMAVLTSAQLMNFNDADLEVLNSGQVGAIRAEVIAAITNLSKLSTTGAWGLTSAQIPVLTTTQILTLGTDFISALSPSAAGALTTQELKVLTSSQIPGLTTAQLPVISLNAISTTAVAGLTTTQLGSLSASRVAIFTTDQLAAFPHQDGLTTSQLASLSTAQVAALPGGSSVTSPAASLTTDEMAVLRLGGVVTPLILDLDGDGVRTLGLDAGVRFDLAGTGQAHPVGWVSAGDGFLVADVNQDGLIGDGRELFGSGTVLLGGQRAPDGFAALRAYDRNGDGAVNARDADWNTLKVWTDTSLDGISQPSELHSLGELGVTQFNLNPAVTWENQGGNWVGLISSYQTMDGKIHELADVWLQNGDAPDPQAKVSGMAERLTRFAGQGADNAAEHDEHRLTTGSGGLEGTSPALVSSMAQTLALFDADGQPAELTGIRSGIKTFLSRSDDRCAGWAVIIQASSRS